jgi:hypothetical protein
MERLIMTKIRNYMELSEQNMVLLKKHFDVLDSRIGAEVILVDNLKSYHVSEDFLKEYPSLKIIGFLSFDKHSTFKSFYCILKGIKLVTLEDEEFESKEKTETRLIEKIIETLNNKK